MRTAAFTLLALTAFAANSVLCRLALGAQHIDAGSFTAIRLASGAVTLAVVMTLMRKPPIPVPATWTSALWLFLYAAPFSFAYLGLTAGTGALLLFGSVQITMMLVALRAGERPHAAQWAGLALALAGLVVLVFPRLAAPPPQSAVLMIVAGASWGVYSIRGRGTTDPIAATTGNFMRAVPMVVALILVTLPLPASLPLQATPRGVVLAVFSGALASGIGYVLWYAALKHLTRTRAAAVQLSVPALAALGGVMFLGETLSVILGVASLLILGGVALVLFGRPRTRPLRAPPHPASSGPRPRSPALPPIDTPGPRF